MSPTALLTSLLHERGLADGVELPTTFLFDGTHRVAFSESMPGYLTLSCGIDCVLPGAHPVLSLLLLRWNRRTDIVGAGSFSTDEAGETIFYRLTLCAESLTLDLFKRELHTFLERVQQFDVALVEDPLEADDRLIGVAPAQPESGPPPGMISV
ncbi:MAG: YbjN domain-containing protein [Opitutaceae bacterium]|nr:YbjN domain-containing protein [Opitutaceae bacterium]